MSGKAREHYRGSYQRRAREMRARASADPTTRCMAIVNGKVCGLLLIEHKLGATWDAGHVRSGDPTSPLQPEASCCNRSNGASEGNRRRIGLVPTRRW